MSSEAIVDRLVREFGYPQKNAILVADKLARLDSPVREAFTNWWSNGQMPNLEIEGYSVKRLMQQHGMNPIAALLTLDWLVREPMQALASLEKGHDRLS